MISPLVEHLRHRVKPFKALLLTLGGLIGVLHLAYLAPLRRWDIDPLGSAVTLNKDVIDLKRPQALFDTPVSIPETSRGFRGGYSKGSLAHRYPASPPDVESPVVWGDYHYDPSKIMVIQFSDQNYAVKFSHQFRTMQCYAQQHGYHHEVVDPNKVEDCRRWKNDFFHKQLCALHHIMQNSPHIEYFIKVDGDVIGGTSDMSLKHWIEDGADMVVFERYYTAEFNAGFYALRNTPSARHLVWNWSEFWWKTNMATGYNGADNGSIHLAILDALQVTGREECWKIYREGLNGTLASYFEFVGCCRGLLGPPRRHHHASAYDVNGEMNVTIWPAIYGPMLDAMLATEILPNRKTYPMHHGIKNTDGEMVTSKYGTPSHLGRPEHFEGKCVKWDPSLMYKDIWPQLYKKALNWSKPAEKSRKYKGIETRCFDAPGPSYHWRVPRFNIEGLSHQCSEGYALCQPLMPNEIFEHHGYRCTGDLNDKEHETPMVLKRLPKPHPNYDEVVLNQLAVDWNGEVGIDSDSVV